MSNTKPLAMVLLLAGLVFFANLGTGTLFDEDEPKNAVCGREMFARNDWIVPTFNEELRTDKPILIYWAMQLSFRAFGVNEFAARFGSALCAMITTGMVFLIGKRLFSAEVGFLAAIVQATSLLFCVVGRAVTPDSFLICCVTTAFAAFVYSNHKPWLELMNPASGHAGKWIDFTPRSLIAATPVSLAMGFAVLAKGPVGVVLPCAIIGLFLLILQQLDAERLAIANSSSKESITDSRGISAGMPALRGIASRLVQMFGPLRFWRALSAMRIVWGIFIVGVVAFPWYIAVGWRTDGAWLQGFLGNHNLGRFLKPMEDHEGPIFYYPVVLLVGCFPWSVVLPWAVWRTIRDRDSRSPFQPGMIFLWCWAGLWIGLFSLAKTKLPNYVLPAYPALSLMTACVLVRWKQDVGVSNRWVMQSACAWWAGIGIGLSVGLPIAGKLLLPDSIDWAWIGMPLIVGAVAIFLATRFDRRKLVLQLIPLMAVLFAVGAVGFVPGQLNPFQDGPYFAERVREWSGSQVAELGAFEFSSPSLIYYHGRRVHPLNAAENVREFFESNARGLVITTAARFDEIQSQLPNDVTVLHRRRRFLRTYDLLLLGRSQELAGGQQMQEARLR